MTQNKRTINAFFVLIILFLISCGLSLYPFDDTFLLRDISSMYLLIIACVFVYYINKRIINKRVKINLMSIGIMIAFWFFLRIEKYVAFEEEVSIIRYLWYAYYIPIISIAQISISTSVEIEREKTKKVFFHFITGSISSLFLILIFTNDLHQMVFKFKYGLQFVDDYTYGIIYYIMFAWIFTLMIATIMILMKKCADTVNKKLVFIIGIYAIIFLAWIVLIVIDKRPKVNGVTFGEVPESVSFLMGGVWILCINIGLVYSNNSYGDFLNITGLALQITDNNYKKIYNSSSAREMTVAQMSKEKLDMLDEKTKVFRSKVSGGYAFWQVDVSELNDVNSKLLDVQEMLAEESEVIRIENELKEKQAKIDEKSRVYDDISDRVRSESQMIKKLSEEAGQNDEMFFSNMRKVCIYAVFIKRMANILILSDGKEYIDRIELLLAINESARYLRKLNIVSDVVADYKEEIICAHTAADVYEVFQHLIENTMEEITALSVIVGDDELKMTLEGVACSIPDGTKGVSYIEDNITYVRLPLRKGERNNG